MIEHQVENLAAAGVTDIVLAVNYRPEIMANALKQVSSNLDKPTPLYMETNPTSHSMKRNIMFGLNSPSRQNL